MEQCKESLIDKVIRLVVSKTNYIEVNSVFRTAELRLSNSERKTLRNYINTALAENFVDLLRFTAFLNAIVLDKASTLYQARKTNKRPKRKKSLRRHKSYRAPKRPDVSAAEILESHKSTVKIGYGLESNVKIPQVRVNDVVIDKNTDKTHKKDKSILYAAGWSIEGAFTKE
jgi:hypothetical protein